MTSRKLYHCYQILEKLCYQIMASIRFYCANGRFFYSSVCTASTPRRSLACLELIKFNSEQCSCTQALARWREVQLNSKIFHRALPKLHPLTLNLQHDHHSHTRLRAIGDAPISQRFHTSTTPNLPSTRSSIPRLRRPTHVRLFAILLIQRDRHR